MLLGCRPTLSTNESLTLPCPHTPNCTGFHYWQEWEDHIGVADDRGYATYRETGGMILEHRASKPFLDKVVENFAAVGIPFERFDRAEAERRYGMESPLRMQLDPMGPPRLITDPQFGTPNPDDSTTGAVFFPKTGCVAYRTFCWRGKFIFIYVYAHAHVWVWVWMWRVSEGESTEQ